MTLSEITKINQVNGTNFNHPVIVNKRDIEIVKREDQHQKSTKSGQRRLRTETIRIPELAAVQEKKGLAEILIEYGNNPCGYSAIAWATHLGHEEIIKQLIEYGVDFKKAFAPGVGNLLDISIKNKNLHLAEFFIQNGIKSAYIGNYCKELDSVEVWEFLEKHRLFDNYKTVNYLAVFIQKEMPSLGIRFLIEHGADCSSKITLNDYIKYFDNEKDYPGILTVLGNCGKLEPEIVKFLVEHGAPINTNLDRNPSWNPLVLALNRATQASGRQEIEKWNDLIAFLIDHGAKWPWDPQNQLAINYSRDAGHYHKNLDLVFLMQKLCNCLEFSIIPIQNTDPLIKNPNAYLLTLLQHAVLENRTQDVRRLLEHGANPNNSGAINVFIRPPVQGIFPKSPVSIAIQNKNPEILNLLLEYGGTIPLG